MIEYEWTIEQRSNYIDEEGIPCFDIEDHDFADRLEQYGPYQWGDIDGNNFALVLIRRDWKSDYSNWSGEEAEAYLENGVWKLPEMFADINGIETVKVPKRFHAELAKRQKGLDKPV